jgi:hypothetical protein
LGIREIPDDLKRPESKITLDILTFKQSDAAHEQAKLLLERNDSAALTLEEAAEPQQML